MPKILKIPKQSLNGPQNPEVVSKNIEIFPKNPKWSTKSGSSPKSSEVARMTQKSAKNTAIIYFNADYVASI